MQNGCRSSGVFEFTFLLLHITHYLEPPVWEIATFAFKSVLDRYSGNQPNCSVFACFESMSHPFRFTLCQESTHPEKTVGAVNGRGIPPKQIRAIWQTHNGFLKMTKHKRPKKKNKLIQKSSFIEIKHLFHKLNLDPAFKFICFEKPRGKKHY